MDKNEILLIQKLCKNCKNLIKCYSLGDKRCEEYNKIIQKVDDSSFYKTQYNKLEEKELINRLANLICRGASSEEIVCLTTSLRYLRHPNENNNN